MIHTIKTKKEFMKLICRIDDPCLKSGSTEYSLNLPNKWFIVKSRRGLGDSIELPGCRLTISSIYSKNYPEKLEKYELREHDLELKYTRWVEEAKYISQVCAEALNKKVT
jgi:hypothetical protein